MIAFVPLCDLSYRNFTNNLGTDIQIKIYSTLLTKGA